MDHGLGHRDAGSARTCCELARDLGPADDRHQRPALHPRRATPTRTRCCCACSPARRWPTRTGSSSTRRDFYLKSPAEMRSLWADKHELREACDNTLLIAERCEVSLHRGRRPDAALPGARRARTRTPGSSRRSSAGWSTRYPGGVPDDVRARADYEVAMILQMGFPSYFLVVADLIGWAREHGIRVGPGPRAPRPARSSPTRMRITELDPLRARPAVRALPQPRTRLHARHRHRLRRAPARRGDGLRHRQVRRRPGRAGRHLRHDQGQAGGQGLRRACSATRSRWASGSPRRCRRRSWARTSRSTRSSTPDARALRRGRRVPRAVRDRRRGQAGRRDRAGARRAQAAVGRARLRGDHVQRSRSSTRSRS